MPGMNGAHDNSEIWRSLGVLQSSIDSVLRTLSENRQADASYRTDIRAELKGITTQVTTINGTVTLAKTDIEQMKPRVDALWQRFQMSKGVTSLAVGLSHAGSIVVAALGGGFALAIKVWLDSRH